MSLCPAFFMALAPDSAEQTSKVREIKISCESNDRSLSIVAVAALAGTYRGDNAIFVLSHIEACISWHSLFTVTDTSCRVWPFIANPFKFIMCFAPCRCIVACILGCVCATTDNHMPLPCNNNNTSLSFFSLFIRPAFIRLCMMPLLLPYQIFI